MNMKRTKRPVDLAPEPDLGEHRRLINRALTQNSAARHLARSAQEAGAPRWVVLVSIGAGVLFIAAVAVLAGLVFLR
jgi:hypothetical protein